jgi:hypothetical protein|tara:strand:- start:82 stop:201 length:120 start_codon:yes stop_codon:yes gene_type:complete
VTQRRQQFVEDVEHGADARRHRTVQGGVIRLGAAAVGSC